MGIYRRDGKELMLIFSKTKRPTSFSARDNPDSTYLLPTKDDEAGKCQGSRALSPAWGRSQSSVPVNRHKFSPASSLLSGPSLVMVRVAVLVWQDHFQSSRNVARTRDVAALDSTEKGVLRPQATSMLFVRSHRVYVPAG